MISKEEYLKALDIVDLYHAQMEKQRVLVIVPKYRNIDEVVTGDTVQCFQLNKMSKHLTIGKNYLVHKIDIWGTRKMFYIYKDNGQSKVMNASAGSRGVSQFRLLSNTEEVNPNLQKLFVDTTASVRLLNTIQSHRDEFNLPGHLGTLTIKEVSKVSISKLRTCRNVGSKSIEEFKDIIKSHGFFITP